MFDACSMADYLDASGTGDSREANTSGSTGSSESSVEQYYRFHSALYDATRWAFLFGRSEILRLVAAAGSPARILEVGCGTGRNLVELAQLFPDAQITAVDLSSSMLRHARRKTNFLGDRIELLHQSYDAPIGAKPSFDLVLFSYSLTMFNPGFELAIDCAKSDLEPGGCVAVVDFHDTRHPGLSRWMRFNHVRTDGHLRAEIRNRFSPIDDELRTAWGGAWRYLMFLGRRV